MTSAQSDIIRRLRQEIFLRQGFRPPSAATVDVGLGPVNAAFPNGVFPTGAVHELLSDGAVGIAAASGFVAALIGPLMRRGGAVVWVSSEDRVFPPGLAAFGVEADKVLFLSVRREKQALWAMEEALKCGGLAAVVGEVREVGQIASRRLQLAVEQSHVTGFLLRDSPRNRDAIAVVARWRVSPVAGGVSGGVEEGQVGARSGADRGVMPGVGFPRWRVELNRIRNGQPGNWVMEWRAGRFHQVGAGVRPTEVPLPTVAVERTRQTG